MIWARDGRPPARCALPWAFRRCITLSSGWHNCSNAEHALATLLHGASLFAITVAKRIAGAIYAYCPRQLDTFYLPSTCNVIHVMFRTRLPSDFCAGGSKVTRNIIVRGGGRAWERGYYPYTSLLLYDTTEDSDHICSKCYESPIGVQ